MQIKNENLQIKLANLKLYLVKLQLNLAEVQLRYKIPPTSTGISPQKLFINSYSLKKTSNFPLIFIYLEYKIATNLLKNMNCDRTAPYVQVYYNKKGPL